MDIFEVLAEPNRRSLLDRLTLGEQPAGQLVAALPELTQPAVSRHLRVLREAGLVEVHPRGQQRVYALKPRGLQQVEQWLEPHRRYWGRHLDALERHLNNQEHST